MADVPGPVACAACGRPLPPQRGKGRRRRYCDARCRDAARRDRARSARSSPAAVKSSLTADPRHEYVDAIASIRDTAGRLLAAVSRGGGHPLTAVVAARELAAASDTALQQAVDRARAAGHSWREVGDVLGTSRQAAFQRFGRPVDPRTGVPMSRPVRSGAVELVTGFLARFTECRWEEVLGDFDAVMRERHDVNRLASGWAQLVGMHGSYQSMGEISPVP